MTEPKKKRVRKINYHLLCPHCGCQGKVEETSEWSYYPDENYGLGINDILVEKLKTTLKCLNCEIVWKVL